MNYQIIFTKLNFLNYYYNFKKRFGWWDNIKAVGSKIADVSKDLI
jgi:hypothetical protein